MCGKPKVVQQDPEGDAQKAAEKATAEANLKKSMRRSTAGAASLLSPTSSEESEGPQSFIGKAAGRTVGGLFKKSTLGGG